jgi:hypothetical protein
MKAYDKVMKSIETEEVFIFDPFEDMMFRSDPAGGWYGKRRGGKEFEIQLPASTLDEALRSLEDDHIKTKEEYEAFT